MAKRICKNCGNSKKRLMTYVELGPTPPDRDPYHFGYRCKICGDFWEVYIVNTQPL